MAPPTRPSLTNVYLVVGTASLFLVTYALLDTEPLPVFGLFVGTAPLLAVLVWLQRYARSRRIASVYDWGLLWWLAWPIVIPLYSVRLEGRRGWRLGGLLTALNAGPALVAGVLQVIRAR
jgi:hypothetical protein